MHEFDEEIDALAAKILEYSLVRLKKDPPLDGPWTYDELYAEVGETITESGLGGEKALDLFKHVLAQACISTDHPRYLAFIPSAPTESSNLFDLVVIVTGKHRDWETDRKSTRLNSSHLKLSRMPSSA